MQDTLKRQEAPARYRAVWRWHFYAGLYVIPFFIMLALSGMAMLWLAFVDGRDGEHTAVMAQEAPLAISAQAEAALSAFPDGTLAQYIAPRRDDLAAITEYLDEFDQEEAIRIRNAAK